MSGIEHCTGIQEDRLILVAVLMNQTPHLRHAKQVASEIKVSDKDKQ